MALSLDDRLTEKRSHIIQKIVAGIVMTALFILGAIALAVRTMRHVSRASATLIGHFNDMAIGDFTSEVVSDSNDEYGLMATSLEKMRNTLLELINQNRSAQFEMASINEELQAKNSIKSGLSELNHYISGERDPVELGNEVLQFLAKFLKIHAGVFYVKNDEHLVMTASYAYKSRKDINNKLEIGEGLVGQCALYQYFFRAVGQPTRLFKGGSHIV